jgi:hypothetical protein
MDPEGKTAAVGKACPVGKTAGGGRTLGSAFAATSGSPLFRSVIRFSIIIEGGGGYARF